MSFGYEADEEEIDAQVTKKIKSAHDIGDPTLLAKNIIEHEDEKMHDSKSEDEEVDETEKEKQNAATINYDLLKSKLKKAAASSSERSKPSRVVEDIDEKKQKS